VSRPLAAQPGEAEDHVHRAGEGGRAAAGLAHLAAGAPVEREPIEAWEIAGQHELITGEGDLRTLPCHWAPAGGLDGFYAARLRRR